MDLRSQIILPRNSCKRGFGESRLDVALSSAENVNELYNYEDMKHVLFDEFYKISGTGLIDYRSFVNDQEFTIYFAVVAKTSIISQYLTPNSCLCCSEQRDNI